MGLIKKWVASTLILTFLVIIAGGVVRTTHSGMGCPDWPRCFGSWVPPTNASELPADFEKYLKAQDIDHTFNAYHTWIEYLNRLAGVMLGLFAVIQFWLLFRKRKEQKTAYTLASAFLAGVIITGLMGALVVKLNLADLSVSLHLFFALVLIQIQLALYMSLTERLFKKTVGIHKRKALFILLVIIFIQFILGTSVRIYIDHVSMALHFEQREAWLDKLPLAFLIHRTFSWLVLLSVIYTSWYCRKLLIIKVSLQKLTGIVLLSMTTGIILYYADMPAIAQPVHLFLATLAVTQTMFIILNTKNKSDMPNHVAVDSLK